MEEPLRMRRDIFALREDLTIWRGLTTMFRWPQRETDSVDGSIVSDE